MYFDNLAWITEGDLKKYYTPRTTHRGARFEIDYPRQGWPNSFLSSDWERDVREYGPLEEHYYHDHERVYRPYTTSPERLERVPSPPYTSPTFHHLSFPTLNPQPLLEFRDTVGEIDMTLRSMNQQYREMIQNMSRVATASSYAHGAGHNAGIGGRRPYSMLEPVYEGGNWRRETGEEKLKRRKRRLDGRYRGYVVKD